MATTSGGGSWIGNAASEAKHIPWWGWVGAGIAILFVGKNLLGGQNTDNGQGSSNAGDVGDIGTPGIDTGNLGGSSGDGSAGGSVISPKDANPGGQGQSGTGTGTGTKTTTKTYTVKSGDTLSSIAQHQHVDEPDLYSVNKTVIESTAKAHGLGSSDGGHWIFPGEVLKIPA